MNKKALSPLTSTIILLVVSILIGIVVMSWGKGYVEKMAAQPSAQVSAQPAILADLNERLSSGEITQEQYNEMKAVLQKPKP